MKTNKILAALLASSALTAAATGGVYASSDSGKDDEAREISTVMTAPVSLAQAIGTAEAESQAPRTRAAGSCTKSRPWPAARSMSS